MNALLTARGVADQLGVSAETVLRWTRRGLPAVRLPGGAIRYRPDALEQWLNARELGQADRQGGGATT
jgi:excisionase family DNA binding protein